MHSKFKAKECACIRNQTGEDTGLRPDIYTEMDNQTFDFTIRVNMSAGYNEKIRKYSVTTLEKKVIPIVISPWFEMFQQSKQ